MFTETEFVSAIVKAAASNPEFIYNSAEDRSGTCYYFQPEYADEQAWHPTSYSAAPSCIIGHALASCGVTSDMISDANLQSEGIDNQKFSKFFADHDIILSHEAIQFASVVQYTQDNNSPWGVAVDAGFNTWRTDIS